MRLRAHRDMSSDPGFPFMVGRLVGTAEATAILLQSGKLSASELYDIGVKLDEVAAWFLDEKSTGVVRISHKSPSSDTAEFPTQELPPFQKK